MFGRQGKSIDVGIVVLWKRIREAVSLFVLALSAYSRVDLGEPDTEGQMLAESMHPPQLDVVVVRPPAYSSPLIVLNFGIGGI